VGTHQQEIKSLPEAEKFYSAIGRFITAFSYLEFGLKIDIANEVKLEDPAWQQIMTHDFAMLCSIAQKVLSRGNDADLAKRVNSFITKCRKLNDERVRIVHGWWDFGRKGGVLHLSRQKLELNRHYKTADEIAALADEACELNW
jgi:hypothetical protein